MDCRSVVPELRGRNKNYNPKCFPLTLHFPNEWSISARDNPLFGGGARRKGKVLDIGDLRQQSRQMCGYQDLRDSTIARRSSLVPDSICSDCSPRPLPRSNWSRCTIRAFLDGSLWVPILVLPVPLFVLPVPLVWRGYLTFQTRVCSGFLGICVRWVCTRRGLIAHETGYTCLGSFNKIPAQIGLNSWRFHHISINQQEGFLTKLGASLS